MYIWLETEHKKESNEIASFLYHRLKNTDLTNILFDCFPMDVEDKTKIKLCYPCFQSSYMNVRLI